MTLAHKIVAAVSLALVFNVSLLAQAYTIQNKTLKEALEIIASQSKLSYAGDPALLESKKANNIENVEGLDKALEQLLKGTGLEAIVKDSTIIIKAKENVALDAISITATQEEGTAEEGYLVKKTTAVGPWRGKSLQDTPYAINVTSKELIENLQATSIDQIYAMNPTIQLLEPQSAWGGSSPILRGFNSDGTVFDGIKREKWQYSYASNPEEYERVETITGLSGFLYGGGNIGGVVNYIPKRPTTTTQRSITVGNAGGSGYYAHADLGGLIDQDGTFGYRFNVLTQEGDTFVDKQNHERSLASLALDWHASDSLLIQLFASHGEDTLEGAQAYWYLASGVSRPSASSIDATKLWGQKWSLTDSETTKYSANAQWNISESINFRTAVFKEIIKIRQVRPTNTIQEDGTYEQTTTDWGLDRWKNNGYGGYTFLDFKLDTFGIKHEVTTGMQVSDAYRDYYFHDPYTVTLSGLTLDSPTYVSKPAGSSSTGVVFNDLLHTHSTNYTIGDSIEFSPEWSMLVGASHVTIEYKDSGYKESAVTPSVSLIYKPISNLSLYVSYMEGFEQGGIAGDEYGGYAVVNASEIMKPLQSEQIEIGAKWTLGDLLLTTALFQIDKGLEYYDLTDVTRPVYVQDGRQVHKGVETTFTGKLTERLTLLGGFTYLDAQVKENKEDPLLEGKRPTNIADQFAKLYVEYAPFSDPNIVLNAGVNYTGSSYGDNYNTDKVPSYTLLNTGVRYTTKFNTYPLVLRLNVNNVTDKAYWINANYLGDSRTIYASATMKF